MNTTKKRRILSIAPIAVAVALSVAACGAPCMAGSSGTPAGNTSTTSNGALSNTSAGTTGTAAGAGTAGASGFGASGGSAAGAGASGASGFGASGGSASGTGTGGPAGFGASGGSASGGSAAGGQAGVSSAGSAAAGSAAPGQAGVASGGFGNSNPAAGMTPDQVAGYCTKFPYDPDIDHGKGAQDNFIALRKNTPVQLVPNVDVMISDNQSIASENRVYAQLKDEMQANFKPLKDFYDQICVAH
jgi:hypothetical protein